MGKRTGVGQLPVVWWKKTGRFYHLVTLDKDGRLGEIRSVDNSREAYNLRQINDYELLPVEGNKLTKIQDVLDFWNSLDEPQRWELLERAEYYALPEGVPLSGGSVMVPFERLLPKELQNAVIKYMAEMGYDGGVPEFQETVLKKVKKGGKTGYVMDSNARSRPFRK